jgi:hypothetical protein
MPFTALGLLEPEEVVGSTAYLTQMGLLPPPQEGVIPETLEMLAGSLSPQGAATGGLLALGTMAGAKGGKAVNQAFKTAQDEAMELAQRNATLPVEQGGLGLPADNTAMDRARAMGFDVDLYHGSDKPIDKFLEIKPIEKDQGWYGSKGVYLTPDPDTASAYANWADLTNKSDEITGQNVMPLTVRRGNVFDYGDAQPLKTREASEEFSQMVKNLGYDTVEVPNQYAAPEYARNYETVVLDPSRIRSKFAAFDPARKNENNLLASILAGLGLGGLLSLEEEERF